jgi:4'-phosphopantetheinyl transferase
MTIYILYSKFNSTTLFKEYESFLSLLPISFVNDILKYRQDTDKISRLFGKLLLKNALSLYNCPANYFENILHTKYKRPYIEGDFDFNISHSGEYVILAISKNTKLGIDIEKTKPLKFTAFAKYMTAQEWQNIYNNQDQLAKFFEYWTKKESIIKADGRGFYASIKGIVLDTNYGILDHKKWFLKELKISPNYKCHLATEINDIKIISQELLIASQP